MPSAAQRIDGEGRLLELPCRGGEDRRMASACRAAPAATARTGPAALLGRRRARAVIRRARSRASTTNPSTRMRPLPHRPRNRAPAPSARPASAVTPSARITSRRHRAAPAATCSARRGEPHGTTNVTLPVDVQVGTHERRIVVTRCSRGTRCKPGFRSARGCGAGGGSAWHVPQAACVPSTIVQLGIEVAARRTRGHPETRPP